MFNTFEKMFFFLPYLNNIVKFWQFAEVPIEMIYIYMMEGGGGYMIIFQQRDGKRIKITKKQFRNYFLKLKALNEEKKRMQIIEEGFKGDE